MQPGSRFHGATSRDVSSAMRPVTDCCWSTGHENALDLAMAIDKELQVVMLIALAESQG